MFIKDFAAARGITVVKTKKLCETLLGDVPRELSEEQIIALDVALSQASQACLPEDERAEETVSAIAVHDEALDSDLVSEVINVIGETTLKKNSSLYSGLLLAVLKEQYEQTKEIVGKENAANISLIQAVNAASQEMLESTFKSNLALIENAKKKRAQDIANFYKQMTEVAIKLHEENKAVNQAIHREFYIESPTQALAVITSAEDDEQFYLANMSDEQRLEINAEIAALLRRDANGTVRKEYGGTGLNYEEEVN
jgi:hypothetical protein